MLKVHVKIIKNNYTLSYFYWFFHGYISATLRYISATYSAIGAEAVGILELSCRRHFDWSYFYWSYMIGVIWSYMVIWLYGQTSGG